MNENEVKTNENVEDKGSEEVKTYTQEEVDALLQREADKRVSEALKKAERKKEAAVKEAEKLAKMNEQEKYEYELKQREQVILEKERKMALMENKNEAMNALSSRGISVALADFVVAEDAETMMDNIKLLEEEFKKSVKSEVEKRIAGTTPKKNLETDGMDKAAFMKLPLATQQALIDENPALYEKYLQDGIEMASNNTVFANKVIESKATDLLLTKLNAKSLMTIDSSLEGHDGMTKTINTYTYTGSPEEVAAGNGNTGMGAVAYVGNDYTVKVVQQRFGYTDEDVYKDSQIVDIGVKGMTEEMVNFLNSKFYAALETENSSTHAKLVGTTTFANGGAISYDTVVDAIADMKVEDESKLVLLIPNEWKADIRKDDDFKTCMMGEIIHNGQIGNICGIPVVATKLLDASGSGASAVPARAFLLTPEAVRLFVKKSTEVEQDRDKNTRENIIYLRESYICALVDATKARRIEEAPSQQRTG